MQGGGRQEIPDRKIFMMDVRECPRVLASINIIILAVFPKQRRFTIVDLNMGDTTVYWHEVNEISPPKGTANLSCMRYGVQVVRIPNQLYPRNVKFFEEFMEEFQKQAIILNPQVKNTVATTRFGAPDHGPSNKGVVLIAISCLF